MFIFYDVKLKWQSILSESLLFNFSLIKIAWIIKKMVWFFFSVSLTIWLTRKVYKVNHYCLKLTNRQVRHLAKRINPNSASDSSRLQITHTHTQVEKRWFRSIKHNKFLIEINLSLKVYFPILISYQYLIILRLASTMRSNSSSSSILFIIILLLILIVIIIGINWNRF